LLLLLLLLYIITFTIIIIIIIIVIFASFIIFQFLFQLSIESSESFRENPDLIAPFQGSQWGLYNRDGL
jgi:flagellar basal body-associated protein FliL